MRRIWKIFFAAAALLFSAGCQQQSPQPGRPVAAEAPLLPVPAETDRVAPRFSLERQLLIADLLYAALAALRNDRLLTPVDDNAHGRYRRVLALDPGNEIAQQGLQDIVERYLELARQASRQGRFENAETYLERAEFVDRSHAGIAREREALAAAREAGGRIYRLDARAVAARTDAVARELVEIAREARQTEAFFLIMAPSDQQARWIYAKMQEAVPGHRLRGDIQLSDRAAVRLINND